MVALTVVGCADVLGLPEAKQLELGTDCRGSSGSDLSLCPAATDQCEAYDGSGSDFPCTITCGTGPVGSGSDFPPAPQGGDRICATLVTTGTPACAAAFQTSQTIVTWYCAIVCGTYMGSDYGTCPATLTCVNNFCQ